MPGFPLPELPKPPDPSVPFKLISRFLHNTKNALKQAKQGVRDLTEEIKKPIDHDES